MTIRRRIKNKWRFNLGYFELKRASYNSDKTKTFEIWYKGALLGFCRSYSNRIFSFKSSSSDFLELNIFESLKDNYTIGLVRVHKKLKNGFPTKILKVEISPKHLEIVQDRKVLLEKFIIKRYKTTLLISR